MWRMPHTHRAEPIENALMVNPVKAYTDQKVRIFCYI